MKLTIETLAARHVVCAESSEAAALIAEHDDAAQSKRVAREDRLLAQGDAAAAMQRAAAKLRKMATDALGSGIWQGAGGLAAAGLTLAQCDRAAVALSAVAKVDGFQLDRAFQDARRASSEVDLKRAEQRASNAGDHAGEAQRLLSNHAQRLQSLLEAQHAARLAAVRR